VTKTFTPIQTLLLGFVVLILLGTFLLQLPTSANGEQKTAFLDALFTAASAVTTTGLVVVDTGTHYSAFGQVVVLFLFQVGGLGYMIFITLISLGIVGRFSVSGRLLLIESIARPKTIEIRKFVKAVIVFAAAFELLGSVLLTLVFAQKLPLGEAVFSGVFHSVSAFCTAGFSLYADSFIPYHDDGVANLIVALITIGGGIGFFVLYDLARFFRGLLRKDYPRKISDHSKLVLTLSGLLMVVGTLVLFSVGEGTKQGESLSDRFLTASFQALSASTTTGFNSIDIGSMQALSLVCLMVLMFIGACPGGTGGGIKTTTFGIILLFIRSVLTNRGDVSAFRRTIVLHTVRKALGIGLIASLYLGVLVLALSISENFPFMSIVFEATSALGTVGLSTGVTSSLSATAKILIMIAMLIGRIGPLAIGYSLVGRFKPKGYEYPTGNVMVG